MPTDMRAPYTNSIPKTSPRPFSTPSMFGTREWYPASTVRPPLLVNTPPVKPPFSNRWSISSSCSWFVSGKKQYTIGTQQKQKTAKMMNVRHYGRVSSDRVNEKGGSEVVSQSGTGQTRQ